jgi:hypothetical protein
LQVKIMTKLNVLAVIAGAALLCATPLSPQWSHDGSLSLSLDQADARVGRPLTPASVAGVNRRVHRRAYRGAYYGSAAGAYYPRANYGYGRPYRY